jgi:hypothetical protein
LDKHFDVIYEYMNKSKPQTWYFHIYAKNSKPLCDRFYQKFKTMMNKDEIYPVNSANDMIIIENTLRTYGLNKDFYPYITVNWQLHSTLVHSNLYKSIATKTK